MKAKMIYDSLHPNSYFTFGVKKYKILEFEVDTPSIMSTLSNRNLRRISFYSELVMNTYLMTSVKTIDNIHDLIALMSSRELGLMHRYSKMAVLQVICFLSNLIHGGNKSGDSFSLFTNDPDQFLKLDNLNENTATRYYLDSIILLFINVSEYELKKHMRLCGFYNKDLTIDEYLDKLFERSMLDDVTEDLLGLPHITYNS